MIPARRAIALLAACQALLLTNGVTLVAINALAGYALAPDKRLATLPKQERRTLLHTFMNNQNKETSDG